VKRFPTVQELRDKMKSMNKIEILRCTHLADQALIVAIDVNFKLLDQDQLMITDTAVLHHATESADRLKTCLDELAVG
jgi:hypothetical protein